MELILLRIPYNSKKFLEKLVFNDSFQTLKEIMVLEDYLINQTDDIVSIIFEIIPNVNDTFQRRKLLNLKRHIFKSLIPFPEFSPELIGSYISNSNLEKLFQHNDKRIELSILKQKFLNTVSNEKLMIENQLMKELKDNWLKSSLLLSSKDLYKSIYDNQHIKLDKNKKTTVLRYLYKSSIKCTPSSLWAGVVNGEWGKTTTTFKGELGISFEFNVNAAKHFGKKLSRSIDFFSQQNLLTYINPTATIINNFLYYWRVESGKIIKCRIELNDTLLEIIRFYNNKLNSILDLKNFISSLIELEENNIFDLIRNFINLDIIRVNVEPFYGSRNPLRDISQLVSENKNKIKTKINLLDKVYSSISHELIDDYLTLTDNDLESINVRANLKSPWLKIEVDESIKNNVNRALQTYYNLYKEFYSENNHSLKDYISNKYGFNTPISLSRISFEKEIVEKKNKIIDQRAWQIPNHVTGRERYYEFINGIKLKINTNQNYKEINLSLDEVFNNKNVDTYKKSHLIEVVFQFCTRKNNTFIIPEMISTQYGRLGGRFAELLSQEYSKKLNEQIFNSIPEEVKEDIAQVNLHLNNNLDGIGFNIDQFNKNIIIYDRNTSIHKMTIPINEVFLYLEEKSGEFSLHLKNGSRIIPWNASSISPGDNFICTILNKLSFQGIANINGHGKTRLELDLDYQPRITLDNLILSRQRFRLKKTEFNFLNQKNEEVILEEFLRKVIEKGIPKEAFLYSDQEPKPQYISFSTIYDLYILKRVLNNANSYIYIEEFLPNEQDYFINDNGTKYNAEVWSGAWIEI